jgi:hypothetical protein
MVVFSDSCIPTVTPGLSFLVAFSMSAFLKKIFLEIVTRLQDIQMPFIYYAAIKLLVPGTIAAPLPVAHR